MPGKKLERPLRDDSSHAAKRLKVFRDPLWEVQPTETAKAYEAFRVYRDLGPTRTINRVCEMLGGLSTRTVEPWSSRYRWVERARAYDAHIDTVLLGAREKEIRAAARSWVARQEQIREREWVLAMGLGAKVEEMLRHPITRIYRRKESKDGKRVYITIVEPARWDWKAAAEILKHIGYQARLAAEMVTDGAKAPTPELTEQGLSDIDAWLKEVGASAEVEDDVPR